MKSELNIGQVAAQAGVNVQTLRYYERRGILAEPDRSSSGYRKYPSETVRLIRFIKRAQELGFSLGEVEDLLALRKMGARERKRVLAQAQHKIQDIDEKVRRLQAMRRALVSLADSCQCKGSEVDCPILDALNEETQPAPLLSHRNLNVINS